ncbi:hypothetical protein OIY81_891 [Cryptosporidium canis]|uniref:Uncharacterized protein n=1 Tax=Cryptosporidium canis TaxID=195482 RepID=A0ABQ8PCP8_9CRYT|nr:hypothetical protein OIY81_891 [Cryptosporidium canis]KAJ1615448.1 hypothetical protein OJ252_99 [Cryptosporidium canis]
MEGAKLNQEEIDVGFGQFILKQFKLRRNLRLFHQKNYSHIDLICSKYKDGHSEHCTDLCSELNDNSANIFGEFERILQELQRREELIRELLAKIEKYESSPKESKSHSSSDPPNYSKPALEFNQGSQYTEVKDMSSVHNNEGVWIVQIVRKVVVHYVNMNN